MVKRYRVTLEVNERGEFGTIAIEGQGRRPAVQTCPDFIDVGRLDGRLDMDRGPYRGGRRLWVGGMG